jgi:hypothetical protein
VVSTRAGTTLLQGVPSGPRGGDLGQHDRHGQRQPGLPSDLDQQDQPEGRRRVPGRDVETVQRVDEARYVERDVQADEGDEQGQAAQPCDDCSLGGTHHAGSL